MNMSSSIAPRVDIKCQKGYKFYRGPIQFFYKDKVLTTNVASFSLKVKDSSDNEILTFISPVSIIVHENFIELVQSTNTMNNVPEGNYEYILEMIDSNSEKIPLMQGGFIIE